MEQNDLFTHNEEQANKYSALCLLVAAGIATVMWLLNVLGFFIVDDLSMNISMSIGVAFLLVPYLMVRSQKFSGPWLKYVLMICFLMGLGAMSAVLSIQTILVWACPIILSCHYYKPKFTIFSFVGALLFMLVSFLISIYIGVWDANIMHSDQALNQVSQRVAYITAKAQSGDNIPARAMSFYYLPRAVILLVTTIISTMLSTRTHRLLVKQSDITRKAARISAELSVGSRIQMSFLPSMEDFQNQQEFRISASMTPAKEVGGDFFDCFMVDPRHLAIVVADVSGKGVPAALFMATSKTILKEHTRPGMDLGQVFTETNRLLCESNSEELFLTAFEGVLDLDTGEFQYVNAGHEIPFLFHKDGSFEPFKIRPGFVLAGMDGIKYKSGSIYLQDGDKFFQYSDGVTEATDRSNQLFGMNRLQNSLNSCRHLEPEAILKAVKADIESFQKDAPQFDDITMLCLEFRKQPESDT